MAPGGGFILENWAHDAFLFEIVHEMFRRSGSVAKGRQHSGGQGTVSRHIRQ